jgi:hypothetical protein
LLLTGEVRGVPKEIAGEFQVKVQAHACPLLNEMSYVPLGNDHGASSQANVLKL